jgi:hypothetical protein
MDGFEAPVQGSSSFERSPLGVETEWRLSAHAIQRGMDERVDGFDSGPFSAARLTLTDVIATGRWAYRPSALGDVPDYFYDGINFWWRPPHERTMVPRAVVPTDGWRHRHACNCRICRESSVLPTE